MSDVDRVEPGTLGLGLGELLGQAAQRWPDRVAAAFPGERLTYRELWQSALAVGEQLVRAGVRPGEHVGLLVPNSGRFLATLFGASLCGAVPVPLNTRYRTDELPYVVAHADLVVLVTVCEAEVNAKGEPVDYPARLVEAFPALADTDPAASSPAGAGAPRLRLVAGFGGPGRAWVTPWPEPTSAGVSAEVNAGVSGGTSDGAALDWVRGSTPDGIALMLYTSGTTSRPKGVQISHRSLVVNGVLGMVGRMELTADDVVWSPAPMCHIGAFVALVGALAVGGRFVSAPYFHADAAIELLRSERVTMAYAGFPAFYFDLANRLRETGGALPDLAVLTTAAAGPEIERVRAGFPGTLQVSVTGSTELSGMICVNDRTDTPEQRATTAGRPLDGIELSIRDGDGREMAEGLTGELWVRGSCLLSAYYKDDRPLLTGGADPGWFRTGDLCVLLDGRLGFRGRLKDMVKVGGENVAAAEVESYLLGHPAVALAQVVGIPDPRLGEVVAAFVEVASGHTLTEQQVLDHCRGALAAYKVPRVVRFVTEWPMSATKISKPALRELVTGSPAD